MNDELFQARDHVAFLHRSREWMLHELAALADEIRAAESRLANIETQQHCSGDDAEELAYWRSSEIPADNDGGPVVVTVP